MNKQRVCPECHKTHYRTSPLCQECYVWHRSHPDTPIIIPKRGDVMYTDDKKEIYCWYCDKSYIKVIQHCYYSHHKSKQEVCEEQDLYHHTQLTGLSYREKMREYNNLYQDVVVKENLLNKGQHTRYRSGQIVPGRGKHIRKGGEEV